MDYTIFLLKRKLGLLYVRLYFINTNKAYKTEFEQNENKILEINTILEIQKLNKTIPELEKKLIDSIEK